MSVNGSEQISDLARMRIVTITVTVRAGDDEWSNIEPSAQVEIEPGWPENVALAAAVGGLKATLRTMTKDYKASLDKLMATGQPEDLPEEPEAP